MTDEERKLLMLIANLVITPELKQQEDIRLLLWCIAGEHDFAKSRAIEAAIIVQAETVGIDEDKFEAQCQAVRFDTLLVEHTHKLDGQSVFGLVNTIAGQRQTIALSIDDTLRLHAWFGVQLRKLGEL